MSQAKQPSKDTVKVRVARQKLYDLSSRERAAISARFFKTGPGEYGEGDVFIGVRVPEVRKVAKEFLELSLSEAGHLLGSEIHEERLLALLILVMQFAKEIHPRKQIYDFYLQNTRCINNWDLVDLSAPQIVGGYLDTRSRRPLSRLAKSKNLWERRIAIVASHHFICQGDFEDTLQVAKILLEDKEDLIHKAVGWMLREVGKRDESPLEEFLAEYCRTMPRTMLRYAIERFPAKKRQHYMAGQV